MARTSLNGLLATATAVGPLHPQNHQLIDISGDKKELLCDIPIPLGEPHYATTIAADKLQPLVRDRYGTNSRTGGKHEDAVRPGQERNERDGGTVTVYMTANCSHFTPEIMEGNDGDRQNSTLWAGQWWQDQVKAADIGLRTKTFHDEEGAVVTAEKTTRRAAAGVAVRTSPRRPGRPTHPRRATVSSFKKAETCDTLSSFPSPRP